MTVFTKFLQPPFPTVLIFSFFVDFFALFSPFSRYHRKIRITIPPSSKGSLKKMRILGDGLEEMFSKNPPPFLNEVKGTPKRGALD